MLFLICREIIMRILLTAINAKYIHSNPAVYSLKAAAGDLAQYVELAEFTINHRTEEILAELYRRKPDVLLFSCYIWNIEYVKELAAECRKVLPEVPIWLGGPEVSFDAERILVENEAVDGILTGEGEESFRCLADCCVRGDREGFAEIPGAVYRCPKGGKTAAGVPAGGCLELDSLPFPYGNMEGLEHRILYYESSRGCPFSCSYCLSSVEKSVRFRDLHLVKKELRFFLDRKVPQVKFVDRTFNLRQERARDIWQFLLEQDNGVTNFHFEIAADLLDEADLALLKQMRPGLIQLEIGVQSTNPRTLEAVRRKTDWEKLKKNVEGIRRGANIHQHLDLIAGLPYEDYTSFARSFDQVFALEPDQLQLGFLKVLKGSPLYREAGKFGIVWKDKPPYEVLYSNWISFAEILQLKEIEEMVEIYYNSHQFRYTLARLLQGFSSPFRFFEELAVYYQESGRFGRNYSRLQRYEILLEFIRQRFPAEERRYRELLTVDLYLRERFKSRPSFAPDRSAFGETLREILRQAGKQNHVEVLTENTKEPAYLIFDYSRRNPLTGNACLSWWKGKAFCGDFGLLS